MNIPRNETDLLQLIRDKVEESVSLDYKRGEALTKPKGDLTKEVTKDVSAFANSAGGLLIYGIAEGSDATKHFPEALSPIDRAAFSKERLEHLINNIQPKIANVEIVPVALSRNTNQVVYVVAIPASTTAHQCTDKRYYRRHNFEAVAMEDYEVRDVMNRRSLPKIELEATIRFSIREYTSGFGGMQLMRGQEPTVVPHNTFNIAARNIGGVVAKHLIAFIEIPSKLLKDDDDGGSYQLRNFKPQPTGEYSMGYAKYGNPQWLPILPSLLLDLENYELPIDWFPSKIPDFSISWNAYCDDAPARCGVFTKESVKIEVEEKYEKLLESYR